MLRRRRDKGFTLIELLIVVAIIGIIAAILIPNLLDALQKAKQKRTLSDMRNTGTSWMSWLTDQVSGAAAGSGTKTYMVQPSSTVLDYATLYDYLRPSDSFFYQQEVPQEDGWGYPYIFLLGPQLVYSNVMVIGAQCRDGAFTATPAGGTAIAVQPFIATDYNQDIIWADGYFVQWPAGKV